MTCIIVPASCSPSSFPLLQRPKHWWSLAPPLCAFLFLLRVRVATRVLQKRSLPSEVHNTVELFLCRRRASFWRSQLWIGLMHCRPVYSLYLQNTELPPDISRVTSGDRTWLIVPAGGVKRWEDVPMLIVSFSAFPLHSTDRSQR